jgi:hypothetical protein
MSGVVDSAFPLAANGEDDMRRITKIIAGLALAAGTFGATAAFAMGDGYHYRSTTSYYYTSPDSAYGDTMTGRSTYLYTQPRTTYYYTSPGVTYEYYAPRSVYGYYDNPYNPYWGYTGPLGQGSGHDMRIGR